ncbi:MAG: hypothetical protein D6802_03020 [Ardenticatenia bacterium]|nr:MAG: hypothetical protein D6802_03020 [Ardenticatenia bacterium]
MTWTHYRLVFRLKSPLHIGYRKVGNLMQTRRYVPGKNLWAALTERITRDHHDGSQGSEYQRIGEQVQQHFRFGYLWPSLDDQTPYWPWEHPDFDYRFLASYVSTALNYDQRAAEEGSLHETEYIAPVARNDQPVYLVGDLWVREENLPNEIANWQRAFQNLQIGGERTYGWGRLQCYTDWQTKQKGQGTTVAGYKWQAQNDNVVLTIKAGKKITAHARAAGQSALSGITGTVEPLVGWERTEQGWKLSQALVCYAPGAQTNQDISVQVDWNGVLKL